MQYSVAHLQYHFAEDWQREVFEQSLCDIGFDVIDGEDAYIPTDVLDTDALQQLLDATPDVTLLQIQACEDQNWNATWESTHEMPDLPLGMRIVPHCAFGAGHHETTGMMMDALMAEPDLNHRAVLDNGCGTGVLAILAAMLGADPVVAIDIDEHSVTNSRENAALNGVEIDIRHACAPPAGTYNYILSNIHRNILLEQMPLYSRYLQPAGQLWMSGFYEADVAPLCQAAAEVGLRLTNHYSRGDWHMLTFSKQ